MIKNKKVYLLVLGIILLFGVVYIIFFTKDHINYKYIDYDDFDSYKDDFNRIAYVLSERGDAKYLVSYDSKDCIIETANKSAEVDYLSSADLERIKRLSSYPLSENGSHASINEIEVKSGDVVFMLDDAGCGIVYTKDIKHFMEDYQYTYEGSPYKYDYKRIDDDWYSFFW